MFIDSKMSVFFQLISNKVIAYEFIKTFLYIKYKSIKALKKSKLNVMIFFRL